MNRRSWVFVLPWDLEGVGGVNQVVANLMAEFRKKSIIPLLFVDQYGRVGCNKEQGVQYFPLVNPCWSPGVKGIAKYVIKLPSIFFRLFNNIDGSVCCINAHYPTLNIINYVLYKKIGLYKGKILLSFHGSDLIGIKKTKGIERYLWFYVFRHVDGMICCSKKLAEELRAYIGSGELSEKVQVVYNGINLQSFQDVDFGTDQFFPENLHESRYILNVATFESKKGQDLLIRAFKNIRQKHNVRLVLIGRRAKALEGYKTLAVELRCNDDIFFIEDLRHDSVLSFFKNACLFCLPSRYEPFGIVLLEAGYYGCPVVASDVGGIPEIIDHQTDGLLVRPDDVEQLTCALDALLADQAEAAKMGERLRQKVMNNFSWEKSASKYLRLLQL